MPNAHIQYDLHICNAFSVVRERYENKPIQYIENLISKNWKFSDKKNLIFFILLLKT